jgi:hypothetical protein
MRPSPSTFAERLLGFVLVALALALGERDAAAQACCATPSAFAPARLRQGETAIVGLVVGAAGVTGSFGADRTFASTGSREVDLSQRVFLGWMPFPRLETSFVVPFVQTVRSAGAVTEGSGGVGDAKLGVRVHLIDVGSDRITPGVHLLGGVTLPTGVPADAAHLPLATDATGTGALQFENGVALEQSFGRFLVNLTGTFALRSARDVRGVREQLGPLFSGFAAASYTFPNALSFALSFAYEASLDARSNGVDVPDSATAKTTLGLAAAMPVARGLRLTAGLSWTPHVSGLGKNELATLGGSLGVVWAWGGPRACPMHPGAASCDCAH